MDNNRLNEIRRTLWNFKYQENYNEEVYQAAVDLISTIDAETERQTRIREWTVVWFVVLFFICFVVGCLVLR
jgi:hypothetical protein